MLRKPFLRTSVPNHLDQQQIEKLNHFLQEANIKLPYKEQTKQCKELLENYCELRTLPVLDRNRLTTLINKLPIDQLIGLNAIFGEEKDYKPSIFQHRPENKSPYSHLRALSMTNPSISSHHIPEKRFKGKNSVNIRFTPSLYSIPEKTECKVLPVTLPTNQGTFSNQKKKMFFKKC